MDLANDRLSPVKCRGDGRCFSRCARSIFVNVPWLQGKTRDLYVGAIWTCRTALISVAMLRPLQAWRGSFHPSPHFHTNSLHPSFIIPPLTAPSHSLATFPVTLSSLVPLPTSFVCLCFLSSSYLSTPSPSFICSPCAIHLFLSLAFSPPSLMSLLLFLQWLRYNLPWCRLLMENFRCVSSPQTSDSANSEVALNDCILDSAAISCFGFSKLPLWVAVLLYSPFLLRLKIVSGMRLILALLTCFSDPCMDSDDRGETDKTLNRTHTSKLNSTGAVQGKQVHRKMKNESVTEVCYMTYLDFAFSGAFSWVIHQNQVDCFRIVSVRQVHKLPANRRESM